MNIKDFLQLLEAPSSLRSEQVDGLERIVDRYPFFQGARVLFLKGLKKQNSYLYNDNLRKTAVHITDRSVLFDFITSDSFNDTFLEETEQEIINQIEVVDEIVIHNLQIEKNRKAILSETNQDIEAFNSSLSIQNEPLSVDNSEKNKVVVNGALLATIEFNKKDKFSFNQWLQLSSFKPIDRSKPVAEIDEKLLKKRSIIDHFIATNPKIKPSKIAGFKTERSLDEEVDSSLMMTETLAKLYIKQEKFQEAIEAYEVLSLKIPEKSGFFADQIKKVRKLM